MAERPRYEPLFRLAAGGMATVWIGAARGALGFRQLVAIKKPHPHLVTDASFTSELVAEARLAAMIHHANVVDVRDVEIDAAGEISLVMDFIEGATLGELLVTAGKRESRLPPRVALRIARDACAGLHAAHELVDERGRPVKLVHRDVSPQNILVGLDGMARVSDFGVAKFVHRSVSTSNGTLKGKLAYMAPEYLRGEPIDRRADIFALGVVLWEALAQRRLFRGETEAETVQRLLSHVPEPISSIVPELAPLDDVIACALAREPGGRFQNIAAMGLALETAAGEAGLLGTHADVAAAVSSLVGAELEARRAQVREKLANEPTLASLMGLPRPADVAATIVDEPPPSPPTTTTLPLAQAASRTAPLLTPASPVAFAQPEEVAPPSVLVVHTRSSAPLLLAVVGALLVVLVGWAVLRSRDAPAASRATTAEPAGTVAAPPPVVDAAPREEPHADAGVVAERAPAPTAAPRHAARTTRAAVPSASPVPSATTRKPPANPYD